MIRELLGRRRFMRDHRWTHAHLTDYLDRDLGEAEIERLEHHVGICKHCRRVLATLRRTLAGLRSLRPEPRPGIADGVIDRLREEP